MTDTATDARSQLVTAGMSEHEAERKQLLLDRAVAALVALGDVDRRVAFRASVPGRIEFLGKHTDYAGGRSLLCAVERGITVVAAARPDDVLRVHDVITDDVVAVRLSEPASLDAASGSSHWSNYVQAVARRVVRNFGPRIRGADVVIASDLPQAAGMSSSSALVVAIFLALARVNDLASREGYQRAIQTNEQLAEYLGTIENGQSFGVLSGERGVGTFGGSEDHTAILCAKPGQLVQYAFSPVRLERIVPFPNDHVLVVAASGVAAEKTGGVRDRYNRLSTMVSEILACWQSVTGVTYSTLGEAMEASLDASNDVRKLLRANAARLDQFLLESNELIPAAADALAQGNLAKLGRVVDQSHQAAEQLLGNQIPETSFLARTARELGAIAASAFGAGFGGSVWALLPEADATGFRARWMDAYASQFPNAAERSEALITHAGPGVVELG